MDGPARQDFQAAIKTNSTLLHKRVYVHGHWPEAHFQNKDIEQSITDGKWVVGPLAELAKTCGPVVANQSIVWPFLRSCFNCVAYYHHVFPGFPFLYQVIQCRVVIILFPITEITALGNVISNVFEVVESCARGTFKENFVPYFTVIEANQGDVVWIPAGHLFLDNG